MLQRTRRGRCRAGRLLGLSLALLIGFGAGINQRVAVAQGAQTGTIAGTVVAREDRQAVPEAVVTVEGTALAAFTNAVGRFRIDGVRAGEVLLVVQASGFLELRVPGLQVPANETIALSVELEVTPNYIERVQVTATKTALSIGEVPAQVDIVDRATIERRGDQELTQAIAHVPGLIVSTQAGSFESVMLRGLPRDGNEFTNTLLLIDGVPQTDSRNSARVVNLPINDASSIEVVRGPNSALYGRTAIGGSVNVRTANPTPDHQLALELTGGQFGMFKGVARASGPVGEWGGYYLSTASGRNTGYFEGPFDFNVNETALFVKLTFVPDARSFGSISLNRVISENSTPTNVPVVNGRPLSEIEPGFDRLTDLNVPGPNYRQREGRLTANYTRELAAWARVVGVFGYRPIQYKFIDDGDVIGGPFDLVAKTLTMFPFELQTDEDIFYQEGRLEFTPTLERIESSLIVGGSYEWTTGFSAGNLIFTDPDTFGWPLNYLAPVIPPKDDWSFFRFGGSDYSVGITGLFAQYIMEPANRLILTAGGRYDRLTLNNTLTFREGRPRVEDTFDAFSPKLSATFKLWGVEGDGQPIVNVYGTYSQAFLPPRRPSQLQPSDVPSEFQVQLSPEDIDNYEVGVKGSLLGGQLSFEGTYFRMTRDGVITTIRQGPFFLPTNAGEHRYKGFETGLNWSVSPKASAYINAAFYRNRFGTFVIQSEGGDTVLTGNRLPISPDRVLNAGVTFTPVPFIDVTADVKHVGDVQVDQGNTFRLDPYTLIDAAVSWRRGPFRVTLSAHNLFNQEYFWNGDISSGESVDPGSPRQILVTTRILFR